MSKYIRFRMIKFEIISYIASIFPTYPISQIGYVSESGKTTLANDFIRDYWNVLSKIRKSLRVRSPENGENRP